MSHSRSAARSRPSWSRTVGTDREPGVEGVRFSEVRQGEDAGRPVVVAQGREAAVAGAQGGRVARVPKGNEARSKPGSCSAVVS
ncbi:hypothetical protein FGW37_05030 [Streptomyces rectiverticillatus]|uniref:hypothetical protein n=1 Tax=Streptomyces rectiverticillatus TaxID=173860 RepID=UPI0015C36648|nr:hypothetical protein [Streptomyces rectiverticillatus]QLE71050.1 hypothetical protein FGW37_05030 [Streptomyces rectiverticillatus]